MTEAEMRELITQQKQQLEENKNIIEALTSKQSSNDDIIKDLTNQITDLKVKNHDLFLKVVQSPFEVKHEEIKNDVQSLCDLTNILIKG